MPKIFRTIRHLLNRRQEERDLAEELAAHREMLGETQENERQRTFGSALRLREESRDAWGLTWLDQLWQDLSYGTRTLRRSPGFTLTAVVVLAFGVGLNLTIFQIARTTFYGRIAVADSEMLQRVVRQSPAREMYSLPPALADFLSENASQFSYLVTERTGSVPLTFENDPQNVRAQFVSGNYFAALRVAPLQGRLLDPHDAEPSAAPVAVLSHGFWQRRYGADPGIITRTVLVNTKPVQIVGVMPAEFAGISTEAELWLPSARRNYLVGQTQPLEPFLRADTALIGVLKPGVEPVAAATELQALTTRWRDQQASAIEKDEVIRARPLGDDERNFGTFIFLIPMVLLVLCASCANLGNMLLARGLARAREIDTRIAVGAGRWRMVRQLMTENLLLAVLGAIVGLFVARIAVYLFSVLFKEQRSAVSPAVDWTMVLAACGMALLSAILFGLAPALSTVRGTQRSTRARRVLLAVQVAASCVLVVSASLVARGAQRLTASGSRLDFRQIVVVDPSLRNANLAPAAARQALESIVQQIAQLPEVRGVTYAGGSPIFGVRVEDTPGLPTTFWQAVDPAYFALMGIPLTRGRNFERNEPAGNIIVSESAARFRWPGEDPIGKMWEFEGAGRTIIGVAGDTDATAFRNPSAIEAYEPLPESRAANARVIVRTNGHALPQLQNIRTAATLPGLTPSVRLLQDEVDAWVEHAGSATEMVAGLGTVASFLAAIGIFGLIGFAVTERTREIGVRVALGARTRDILRSLFAHYALPLAWGAVLGLGLAIAFVQSMRTQIILGLIEFDPLGYLLGLAAFAVIVVGAIIIPVRRALRIDPASALRWE